MSSHNIIFSFKNLGPVVQSIIYLMSSLRGQLVKCFMTFIISDTDIFVEKMREAFALCKSFLQFFYQKILANFRNFNETLTNDIVSFEQPGPGKLSLNYCSCPVLSGALVMVVS